MRIFQTITSTIRSLVGLRPNYSRSLFKRTMLINRQQQPRDRLLAAIRTGVTKVSKRKTFLSPQTNPISSPFKALLLTIQTMMKKISRLPRSAFRKALAKRTSIVSRSMPWRTRRGDWTRRERYCSRSKTMRLVSGSKSTKKWSPIMIM